MTNVECFKAYDIRGIVPDQLNDDIAYKIGRAFAEFLKPKTVVVGYDARLSSPSIAKNVIEGLIDGGSSVIDIAQCGTEMVYFATSHLNADGGIMITASHNPKQYNGMKFVRAKSRPISGDTGLNDIRDLVASKEYTKSNNNSLYTEKSKRYYIYPEYADHILSYVDKNALKPLKIVAITQVNEEINNLAVESDSVTSMVAEQSTAFEDISCNVNHVTSDLDNSIRSIQLVKDSSVHLETLSQDQQEALDGFKTAEVKKEGNAQAEDQISHEDIQTSQESEASNEQEKSDSTSKAQDNSDIQQDTEAQSVPDALLSSQESVPIAANDESFKESTEPLEQPSEPTAQESDEEASSVAQGQTK